MKKIEIHKGNDCSFVKVEENILAKKSNKFEINSKKTRTLIFENPVCIVGRMSVVGPKEGEGPIGEYFHQVIKDIKMGQKSFEFAEGEMLKDAIFDSIANANFFVKDIDVVISGDLLNQITTSSYVARELGIPFIGVYSACSTITEALGIASSFINAGYYSKIVCATVSHFATAERQYRYPLEYGCQRPPYSQWTVTAAGSLVLSDEGSDLKITAATFGRVIDYGVRDISNMGAAMAPAAYDTMLAHFKSTNTLPKDYDLILTGDLGKLGSDILRKLLSDDNIDLGQKYIDCGVLMYDKNQHTYQGGSGCGCSASILSSYIIDKINQGYYNKVLLLATGALMSTQSNYQGETIPCISHGIVIEKVKNKTKKSNIENIKKTCLTKIPQGKANKTKSLATKSKTSKGSSSKSTSVAKSKASKSSKEMISQN